MGTAARRFQTVAKLRRRQLRYHLRGALGPLARMYWLGRLDELKRIGRGLKRDG